MEFTPAHAHPFSVADAAQLDIGTIVGEITRLRNSLDHLARSQADLLSFLADAEDADLRVAWTENEAVIASQTERIALLRSILASKVGDDSLAHYGVDGPSPAALLDAHARAAGTRTGSGSGSETETNGAALTANAADEVPIASTAQSIPAAAESVTGTASTEAHARRADDDDDEGGLHL